MARGRQPRAARRASAAWCPRPSARELPGTAPRAANRAASAAGTPADGVGVPEPQPQEPARERPDRRGGAEQPGVAGDAAERRGVVVVHLAGEDAPAPGVGLGRRDVARRRGATDRSRARRRAAPRRATRRTASASGAPPASSISRPSRMNPRSLYSWPRAWRDRRAARRRARPHSRPGRPAARKYGRCAGSPLPWPSRSATVTCARPPPANAGRTSPTATIERQRAGRRVTHRQRAGRDHLGERGQVVDGARRRSAGAARRVGQMAGRPRRRPDPRSIPLRRRRPA